MNGWQRLAIFLATLLAAPVFLMAFGDRSNATAHVGLPYDDPRRSNGQLAGALYAEAIKQNEPYEREQFNHCDIANVKIKQDSDGSSNYWLSCRTSSGWAVLEAAKVSAIPWFIVWIIVSGIGWVVVAFRNPTKV